MTVRDVAGRIRKATRPILARSIAQLGHGRTVDAAPGEPARGVVHDLRRRYASSDRSKRSDRVTRRRPTVVVFALVVVVPALVAG